MRLSKFPLHTLKEVPKDAEIVSHQLMLRSGLIRRLASGLYTWLPLGMRILGKVQRVIREEMNNSGAHEILMPLVQPAELWHESGRWGDYGAELARFEDRHGREFCLGPTHEEIITDLARNEIKSYKQLPLIYYQIQTKFRDEIRPRFGVMRAREFLMKDAYSFHLNEDSLLETYEIMKDAYIRILERLDLRFSIEGADPGAIGGNLSEEFHIIDDSGEIEVGHIFQLGKKYSKAMKALVLDESGEQCEMFMGCYGMGVTRLVAASIQQNNDSRGIIWPEALTPFDVVIIPINLRKSYRVKEVAKRLYDTLKQSGYDVLLDDRDIRPGAQFADADLIGVSHRVVVSDKELDQDMIEYKNRSSDKVKMIKLDKLVDYL
ncbi:MAG: proline--tRNA ligase [Pseudomonadota bacterium]|nr:proline--tRNA ligase [Pseudomonadota bacterium]|tara:strand:+ start:2411 stop:3541 length:1131 start_codon:yes stop_codon:yes gene_type:complete